VTSYDVNITPARVVRHAASAQGRDAALIDIAQDLLLRHLDDIGLLVELAFKGGTALRKLYAGNEGRFSLDLDFSVSQIGTDSETVLDLLEADRPA
jgi:predicted nucleotidyltransferase component of viral defense system